jgi:hypothetical protein
MPMRANSPIVWSNSACPVEPQPRVDGAAQLTPDFADFELRSGSDRPTRQDAPAEFSKGCEVAVRENRLRVRSGISRLLEREDNRER